MSQVNDICEDSEDLETDGTEIWLKCKKRQSEGLVHVDYLSFSIRSKSHDDMTVSSLAWQVGERLAALLGGKIEEGTGAHFYKSSLRIKSSDTLLSAVWFGGSTQKGMVHCQIPAAGWLASGSWLNHEIHKLLLEFEVSHLSRVDLARDCFEGESSYLAMREAYEQGLFKPSRGVSPSLWNIEDQRRGSTCHVGRRENGKLIRGYEKSMQLARKQGWFRIELELRSVNRRIPIDALLDPAAYFSGANKYLADLANSSRIERVTTFRTSVALSLSHITDYARIGYGKLVKLFVDAGLEAQNIVERLIVGVQGLPRRLRLAQHEEILRVVGLAPPAENALSGAI